MWRSKIVWRRAVVALSLVSLTGCMVGPNYHRPVAPTPPQFKEGGTPESGTPDIAYSDWWRVFGEPELARL
jgi:multidrug efflux system outer membrane protein